MNRNRPSPKLSISCEKARLTWNFLFPRYPFINQPKGRTKSWVCCTPITQARIQIWRIQRPGRMDGNEGRWSLLPDSLLLQIFTHLHYSDVPIISLVCKAWHRVSCDEFLWRHFFYKDFQVDPSVPIMPGRTSWRGEYRRLVEGTPVVETQTISKHDHQVLHVSFSHQGDMFATSSKDGHIIVWTSSHPAQVKYAKDMKIHSWKYTQFSQFNSTDTLLLVSGVHFGTYNSTSGEIAVFNLERDFQLQCRVLNKPYDIFGTWYNDQYLLSGDLHWLAHLVSRSVIWLNKASQETSSEHDAILVCLYKFYNRNASSVRTILVANCLTPDGSIGASEGVKKAEEDEGRTVEKEVVEKGNPPSHRDLGVHQPVSTEGEKAYHPVGHPSVYTSPITYTKDYRKAETEPTEGAAALDNNVEMVDEKERGASWRGGGGGGREEESLDWEEDQEPSPPMSLAEDCDKFLIFTTGSKTYSPHQIGFKRIKKFTIPTVLEAGPCLRERIQQRDHQRELRELGLFQDPNWLDFNSVADRFDTIDHLIDLNGHIIGMGLSPDHRYLYVNSRPWQANCVVESPLSPPRIAEGIDLHVIDLTNLTEVGTMLRAHKAYTPNDECFFIFLDVSHQYVASGAEDKHGYIWERHYGVCLSRLPHKDVVNAVAFNPRDPEMLITVSDDHMIKIWRSRRRARALGIDPKEEGRTAKELRLKHPRPTPPPPSEEATLFSL
ncbi:F-box/WD repeat-containing protein 5-like isoform X2 [Eriocheir sinensis]|uniref:F-box/WD repeat-containing protein 5-like isoform X2 n=1 Tax=Eriocheir sinensis TaxID=95602 RepID=UPI0021C70424|nr:F-box/WD repeat-containing protein 5-like isoform X2 [Eriocheir sinensis]